MSLLPLLLLWFVMDQITKTIPEGSCCSEMLRYALRYPENIIFYLWHLTLLLIMLISLYIHAPLSNHDLTSSRCSGCCVHSHHSWTCGCTITPLFIFILVANNKPYCSVIFDLVIWPLFLTNSAPLTLNHVVYKWFLPQGKTSGCNQIKHLYSKSLSKLLR